LENILNNYLKDSKLDVGMFYSHEDYGKYIINIFKELNLNNPIKSVFGAPDVLWNGGRHRSILKEYNYKTFKKHVNFWNNNNIQVFITFSNWHLEAKDLKDEKCNQILNYLNNSNIINGVVIVNDLLKEYIRNYYPNLIIKSSIDRVVRDNGKNNIEYYINLLKQFDIVNIHTDDSLNIPLLKDLKEYSNNLEIILNEPCQKNCPYRKLEHSYFSNVSFNKYLQYPESIKCDVLDRHVNPIDNNYTLIFKKDIDILKSLGYNLFKIQGRNYTKKRFSIYLDYYIFQEEYSLVQNLYKLGKQ